MAVRVRKMERADLAACAGILCSVYNNDLWQCHWSPERAEEYLTDLFEMKKFVGYTALDGPVVIGGLFAREKVWWNNSEVFVEEMFVRPEDQRKGCGGLLLARVEDHVRQKGLAGITLSTNRYAAAPAFYRKHGFADCGHVLFMAREL